MSDLPRRRLLALAGTGAAATIAGCASSDDDPGGDDDAGNGDATGGGDDDPGDDDATGGDDETGSTDDTEGTVLGDIPVENLHDEAHTIDVLVEFGDEIEHWSTQELAVDDGATLDRDWSTDPGEFRVTTRLDRGEPRQIAPEKWNDPDCLNIFVLVTRQGDLEVWGDTDGGPCGDGEAEPDDPGDD